MANPKKCQQVSCTPEISMGIMGKTTKKDLTSQ
jgi:hypothetical protein